MQNLFLIEESFKKYVNGLNNWIPEGVYYVNLDLLYQFDLLHFQPLSRDRDPSITRYFQIIESNEKITLINDQFVVWIVPDRLNSLPVTYTLIAHSIDEGEPKLEAAFITSGVYNSSKLVLKILEKFLGEIQENELVLTKLAH
jgi:hypothetical protein